MKSLIILVSIFSLAFGIALEGDWKEDDSLRENFADFIFHRGLDWIERTYATSVTYQMTQNITKYGNVYRFAGICKFLFHQRDHPYIT